jgi:hypothetical protein
MAPVIFVLTLFAVGLHFAPEGSAPGAIVINLIGLFLALGTLILAGFALRQVDSTPQTGGRSLAMTGATTSLVCTLWSLTITVLLVYWQLN